MKSQLYYRSIVVCNGIQRVWSNLKCIVDSLYELMADIILQHTKKDGSSKFEMSENMMIQMCGTFSSYPPGGHPPFFCCKHTTKLLKLTYNQTNRSVPVAL